MILKSMIMWLVSVFLTTLSTAALAHKVNLFAYAEGDQVDVQGYFSDGHKAQNSEVTVYSLDGKELLKGKTNKDGDFTFPTQGKQSLRIVLNAGQGHQASYVIPLEDLTGTVPVSSNSDAGPGGSTDKQSSSPHEAGIDDGDGSSSISEAMVRKAVAQGVLPLAREISELKERRGFSDIVGGIGFIVGLLGVFSYFRARHESHKGRETNSKGGV